MQTVIQCFQYKLLLIKFYDCILVPDQKSSSHPFSIGMLSPDLHPCLTEETLRALRLLGVETARDLLAVRDPRTVLAPCSPLNEDSLSGLRLACLARFPQEALVTWDPRRGRGEDEQQRITTGMQSLGSWDLFLVGSEKKIMYY